MVDIGIR